MEEITVTCPYCGEPGTVDFSPDDEEEEFVQDCAVCCRPWRVRLRRRRDGSVEIAVDSEG